MNKFITYKNIQVHYTDTGKGSAIVLLHGFLENSSMWNDIVHVLTRKNRVITIDLLGHGNTDCLGYIQTMNDYAQMVKHVLNHLKLRKYTLIGHSMGGYIALEFAHMFPDSIKGICLMNATFENDNEQRKLLRTRAIKMATTNYTNLVRMSFTNLFSEQSRETYKLEIKNALTEALKTTVRSYIASQEGMKIRKNYTEFFKNAPFKKTIILGRKDSLINVDKLISFSIKNNIPTYVLSEGHMSHIENKHELIEALTSFIRSVR